MKSRPEAMIPSARILVSGGSPLSHLPSFLFGRTMPVDFSEPRPHVTTRLLALLRDRFGLNPSTEPKDLGGAFSLNVRIDTLQGPYVARVHGTQTGPARLEAIQCARRHLAAGGVPSAEPVSSRVGEAFLEFDGHLVEVERYVDHDANMDTWQRLERGLPYLARTHALLRMLAVGTAGRRAPLANHIEPNSALSGTLRGVGRMRGWNPTEDERDLAVTFEELAHRVHDAEREVVVGLPRQLVHGDFWDNNVLFRSHTVVLVTDLDFMAERLRIDDLALTLFFANSSIGGDRLSDGRIRQMRALVDAYDSGLSDQLSAAERRALPAAIARQALWSIGWWVPVLPEKTARREAALRAVDAEWTLGLMKNIEQWREAFTSTM